MSTPLDYFKYKNGILRAENVSLQEIEKKVGTPAYVYSKQGFLKPLKEIQDGLKGLNPLVCFAVKSNSNISILKMLSDAGAGMDLVSGGELYRAQAANVPGDKIVFSGVGKTAEEMQQGLNYGTNGIFSFNVESVAELALLSQVAAQMNRIAPVALRFNPDVDAKTHPYISTGLKKNKFGLEKKEILQIARNLAHYPGVSLRGISIHIGSQLLTLAPLEDAFKLLAALIKQIEKHAPGGLHFLDLGGGVGVAYDKEKTPPLPKYTQLIHKYFGSTSSIPRPLKILIEPGRTISGNSGILLTRVLYRKTRNKRDFLIVDAAMNDLMRPALYGSYHGVVPVAQKLKTIRLKKTSLVGPICESSDCFGEDRPLSQQIGEGNLLAILSAGAYGFSMSSNYNSRRRPPEILVDGDSFKVIRKRESYEDLVRHERGLET